MNKTDVRWKIYLAIFSFVAFTFFVFQAGTIANSFDRGGVFGQLLLAAFWAGVLALLGFDYREQLLKPRAPKPPTKLAFSASKPGPELEVPVKTGERFGKPVILDPTKQTTQLSRPVDQAKLDAKNAKRRAVRAEKNKQKALLNEEGWLGAFFAVIGGLIILALVVAGIWVSVYASTHHETHTFTVTDKQAVASSNSSGHEYLVYTDAGTFKDTDSVLNRKYNSSDVYGQIKVGHKYTCDVTGFRLQFTSDYQNIISCTEVK